MQLPTHISYLAFAFTLSAVLTVLLLTVWLRARAARGRVTAQLARLEDELAIIQAGNIGLGKKLLAINRQLQGLGGTTEALTIDVNARADHAWSTAHAPAHETGHRKASFDAEREPPAPSHNRRDDLEPEFERAQALLADGMGIEQVVQLTGLTRSEAELIQLLHPVAVRQSAREPQGTRSSL